MDTYDIVRNILHVYSIQYTQPTYYLAYKYTVWYYYEHMYVRMYVCM